MKHDLTMIKKLVLISLAFGSYLGCAKKMGNIQEGQPTESNPIEDSSSKLPPKGKSDPPKPQNGDSDPTHGSGGAWSPGQVGRSTSGAYIYIPKSYNSNIASSVIFLFHIEYKYLKALADQENIILVDTEPMDKNDTTTCNGGKTYPSGYINQTYILKLMIESRKILVEKYNIDLRKVFYAGWSHGGDLAMKFGSIPTADSLAPDDSSEVACTSSPGVLLPLQQEAHVGQVEVAGVMAFPGHYGYYQIDLWKLTNTKGTRKGCFAYSTGDQDGIYTKAYDILIPKLKAVKNYQNNIYYKVWSGWGHDLVPNSNAVKSAWDWIKSCAVSK